MVRKIITILAIALLPFAAFAARTNDLWVWQSGSTYLQVNYPGGLDLLINGSNRYVNFNTVTGSSGYGVRDNAGTIEFKNSGGSWAGIGSGGGAGTVTSVATNNGLTGGTITTTGTIGLAAINANSVLGNITGASGVPSGIATTSLYTGTAGQILGFLNGGWIGTATTTFSSPLIYASGNVTCQVATDSVPGCLSAADHVTFNGKGTGTVTAVSVASANGFAGSSSGGATPALTLTTSITGLLKGNGTAISAAALTDFPIQAGNTVLVNQTSGSAAPTALATSTFANTLHGVGTNGFTLAEVLGVPTWVATTTFSTGLTYGAGAVTCDTASASIFGCLSVANFSIFNNKQAPGFQIATTTMPTFAVGNLAYLTGTIPTSIAGIATSSLSVGTGLTNSGTLGALVGGNTSSISFASIAANSLWVNQTGATAVPTAIATSSLFTYPWSIANGGTNATSFTTSGNVLAWDGTRLITASLTGPQTLPFASTTALTGTIATFTNLLGVNDTTPDFRFETAGSTGSGYFGITNSSDGDVVTVNSSGFVGISSSTPTSKVSIGTGAASSTLTVAEYAYGAPNNLATSTAITIDARASTQVQFPIGTSATTLTICNMQPGQTLRVRVVNPNATAGALTWAVCAGSQLYWPAKTIPTQTLTANDWDIWSFAASVAISTSTNAGTVMISGAASTGF